MSIICASCNYFYHNYYCDLNTHNSCVTHEPYYPIPRSNYTRTMIGHHASRDESQVIALKEDNLNSPVKM